MAREYALTICGVTVSSRNQSRREKEVLAALAACRSDPEVQLVFHARAPDPLLESQFVFKEPRVEGKITHI